MGTLAELFESGEHKAKKGMFNNLVMLTRIDGKVTESEIGMLSRMARHLSLTPEQVKEIIEHPDNYPMIPPSDHTDRCLRMILYVKITFADGHVTPEEDKLLYKCGIALGFTDLELKQIVPTIVSALESGKAEEDILQLIC